MFKTIPFAAQWAYLEEANEIVHLFHGRYIDKANRPVLSCTALPIEKKTASAAYRHAYKAAVRERDMIAKLVNLSDDD